MKFLRAVQYVAAACMILSIPACVGGSVYEAAEFSKAGEVLFWSGLLTFILTYILEGE